jgi:tetratricopeptide (TPR) repeat protein
VHRANIFFAAMCGPSALLGLLFFLSLIPLAAPAAQAQGGANADICASTNDAAYSPAQRIAACGALIDTLKDQPKALAAALVNRGATYWTIDKIQLSLADFDRAIALDPSNARAFRERSNACRSIGRLDQALADANQAVRLDPNDAKAFDNRGNVFNNSSQYDRAIADYAEALRLAPADAQTYMDRGVAYYFKKAYQAAISDYDQAIKIDPKKSRAYTNRGAAYKKLGRNDRAIADESEAIRLDPLVPEYFDIAACPMPRTAITTAPSPTTMKPSGCRRRPNSSPTAAIPTITKAISTRHCRLRPRGRARSGFLAGLQQSRRRLSQEGRSRSCHRRL